MANFHGGDRPARVGPIGYWQPTIPSIPMITQSSGNCQHKIFTMYSGRTLREPSATRRTPRTSWTDLLRHLLQIASSDRALRSGGVVTRGAGSHRIYPMSPGRHSPFIATTRQWQKMLLRLAISIFNRHASSSCRFSSSFLSDILISSDISSTSGDAHLTNFMLS